MAVAGFLATALGDLIIAPIDTIKTLQQGSGGELVHTLYADFPGAFDAQFVCSLWADTQFLLWLNNEQGPASACSAQHGSCYSGVGPLLSSLAPRATSQPIPSRVALNSSLMSGSKRGVQNQAESHRDSCRSGCSCAAGLPSLRRLSP